ncbi:dimethylarginine dimethylaminohydrolase family protein [Amycolatopsis nigrescens]|uniref:dimethylarginine dimethylaminohydrolase family protein n=1 Tax=Amycolatopsis nigrescens TaxID=381445 RepID=UPI000372AA30|nr:arginine deiminase family protein [Amycolatopsis nigrescens]
MTMTAPIDVADEFGRLREVCVGIFDPDAVLAPVSYSLRKYLPAELVRLTEESAGWSLREIEGQERIEAIGRQLDTLAALYAAHGVRVHRPRRLTEFEAGFVVAGGDPMFARDPLLVIGNRVIETSLMMPSRRKEIFAYRDLLAERLAGDPGASYVAVPHPAPASPDPVIPDGAGPFLEGGDVFVLGTDVLVGNSGLASNRAGIEWLDRLLGPAGYRVHEVPLAECWLHLDCVLAVVRPGLAICHRDGLAGRVPDVLAGWDLIDATAEEAHAMGCNTVCLAPNTVVIPQEHGRLIDELRQHRAEVVSGFGFDLVSEFGGGVRCATVPLVRSRMPAN